MTLLTRSSTGVKVSVAMITYNHERFVAQAIESVLMQQTDFDVELVIGEDCSTDGTRAVVCDYADRYPGRIRLLLPDRNQGTQANFLTTLNECSGEYIALCEGDDYWLSKDKLQLQAHALDTHPDWSLCVHEATNLWPDGHSEAYVRSHGVPIKTVYSLPDIVQRHFLPTASMLFPSHFVRHLPCAMLEAPGPDWLLHAFLARHGKIGFLDQVWSVRRVHAGGLTSMASQAALLKHVMRTAHLMDVYLDREFTHILRPLVLNSLSELTAATALGQWTENSVHDNLPQSVTQYAPELSLSAKEVRQTIGASYLKLVYMLRERRDVQATRTCWLQTFRYGSAPLRNRGFWSVGGDAILGDEPMASFRRIKQHMFPY